MVVLVALIAGLTHGQVATLITRSMMVFILTKLAHLLVRMVLVSRHLVLRREALVDSDIRKLLPLIVDMTLPLILILL